MVDRAQSVKQVAAFLGVRQHAVLSLIRSGQLRVDVALQQGGRPRWRIMPDDFEGFLLVEPSRPRQRAIGGARSIQM